MDQWHCVTITHVQTVQLIPKWHSLNYLKCIQIHISAHMVLNLNLCLILMSQILSMICEYIYVWFSITPIVSFSLLWNKERVLYLLHLSPWHKGLWHILEAIIQNQNNSWSYSLCMLRGHPFSFQPSHLHFIKQFMHIHSTHKHKQHLYRKNNSELTNARVSTRNALLKLGFESSHMKRTWVITGADANLLPLFLQAPWVKRVRLNLLQIDMVEIRKMNTVPTFPSTYAQINDRIEAMFGYWQNRKAWRR
jgi:hypothetical protein